MYDLELGKIMKSFSVFDGVRVHGIASNSATSSVTVITVFGETRVKLFSFSFDSDSGSPQLTLIHLLPKFSHWVLDVCFLEVSTTHYISFQIEKCYLNIKFDFFLVKVVCIHVFF